MRSSILLTFFLFFSAPVYGQNKPENDKKDNNKKESKIIKSEAGLNIPEWGIAVDALYDPRLDNIIPGYKILNVVIANRRETAVQLDVNKDKWSIVDSLNRRHTASNHVAFFNDKLWQKMPSKLQQKLEYPNAVRPGNSVMIDLFFPNTVSLNNFKEVTFKSASLQGQFTVYTTGDHFAESTDPTKEVKIPSNPSSLQWSKRGDLEKFVEDKLSENDSETTTPKETSSDPSDDNFDKFKAQDNPQENEDPGISFDPSFDDAIILK